MIVSTAKVKYQCADTILVSLKKDPTELCTCKCHYGGAVSCPSCKSNHGITCCHCSD